MSGRNGGRTIVGPRPVVAREHGAGDASEEFEHSDLDRECELGKGEDELLSIL